MSSNVMPRHSATGGGPPRRLKALIFIAWTAVANAQRLGAPPWARRVALAAECDLEDLKCEMFSTECSRHADGCSAECKDSGFDRCDDLLAICGIGKDLGELRDAAIEKIEEDLEEAEELGGAAEHPCAATPCLEGKFKKCAMAVEAWCAPVATGGNFSNGDPKVSPGAGGTFSSGARPKPLSIFVGRARDDVHRRGLLGVHEEPARERRRRR